MLCYFNSSTVQSDASAKKLLKGLILTDMEYYGRKPPNELSERTYEETPTGSLSAQLGLCFPEDALVTVLHQSKECKNNVLVAKEPAVDKSEGLRPLAVWEVYVDEVKYTMERKREQMFRCIRNCGHDFERLGGNKICVGVVASLSERGPKTVEVYATYQATIPSKSGSIDEYKLFHVPLLNGIWSASLLSKILNGLTWWSFHCNEDLTPDHTALSRNSIRIGDHVYKTFNYTGRTIAKEHQRQSQHTLNHLGNEYSPEKVLSSDAMEVIRYKFIDGSHAPTHSNQVLSLLMKFQTLWNQNLVFADFRLSNVVFLSDQKGGVLIDYDMMRVHGEGQYLPGFCEEVPDGVRHPDAYEYATTRTEHDQYALSHTLLKLVKPKNPDHQADWEAACTFIRDDVALAVQLLTERCFEIELIDASVLPSEGTGTRAREARKKRRADSGLPEVPNSKRMTTSFPAEESPSAT
jgi:hypothetical protein